MIHLVATSKVDTVHQICLNEYNNREFGIQTLYQQLIYNSNQILGAKLLGACLTIDVPAITGFGDFDNRRIE
jgi:hypothetical protein